MHACYVRTAIVLRDLRQHQSKWQATRWDLNFNGASVSVVAQSTQCMQLARKPNAAHDRVCTPKPVLQSKLVSAGWTKSRAECASNTSTHRRHHDDFCWVELQRRRHGRQLIGNLRQCGNGMRH